MEVDNPKGSSILTISFRNRDKSIVEPVLNALLAAYMEKQHEVHKGGTALEEYYTKMSAGLRGDLEAVEEELKRVKTNGLLMSIDATEQAFQADLTAYQQIRQAIGSGDAAAAERMGSSRAAGRGRPSCAPPRRAARRRARRAPCPRSRPAPNRTARRRRSPRPATKFFRLPTGGGPARPPIAFDTGAVRGAAVFGNGLPGDRGVFFSMESWGARGYQLDEWLLDPKTGKAQRLFESAGSAAYSPTGHIVFSQGAVLMAAPFDLGRLAVTGEKTTLPGSVRTNNSWDNGDFSISRNGTLVSIPGGRMGTDRRLVTVDPSEKVVPFIATLGMMVTARGLAKWYTRGTPVGVLRDVYGSIGAGIGSCATPTMDVSTSEASARGSASWRASRTTSSSA
jgi:hypothetical protein